MYLVSHFTATVHTQKVMDHVVICKKKKIIIFFNIKSEKN